MDEDEPAKSVRCRELLDSLTQSGPTEVRGVISTQVLQETYVSATRKLGIAPLHVRAIFQSLESLETVIVTPALIHEAIECSQQDQLSFWDALIICAAVSAGCDTMWTEDLNHGQIIRGVRITNPLK